MNKYYKIAISLIVLIAIIIISFWIFHTLHKPAKLLKHKVVKPELVTVKGRVTIVLDDWGYNSSDLDLLFKIKRPITVSILPNLRYSEKIAKDAKDRGYGTMLHLPLESRNNEIPEKGTIYCTMDKDEIIKSLKLSLKSVPGVSGVNNHQGSKGTEDSRTMKIILSELKNDKLFFLDSLTTSKSVCSNIAKTIGLKYAKRDVFLDEPDSKLGDEEQINYVKKQLNKLSDLAIKRGWAVGIGHDKKITLSLISDMMPQLEKKGIKFVFVPELTK